MEKAVELGGELRCGGERVLKCPIWANYQVEAAELRFNHRAE